MLGFDTRSKTVILGAYLLIPIVHLVGAGVPARDLFGAFAPAVAREWFAWTIAVVGGRVAYLVWKHGARLALVWFVKLITDPLTDIAAYSPRYFQRA